MDYDRLHMVAQIIRIFGALILGYCAGIGDLYGYRVLLAASPRQPEAV